MSENTAKLCPVCGTPMEQSKLDGSFRLDGSANLGGWVCPKCTQSANSSKPDDTTLNN